MASYVAINNSEIDPDSPITADLMTKLRDNPLAISEGATGAPLISGALVKITATTEIGSFIFARGSSTINYGDSVAGSALLYAGGLSSATATATFSGSTPILQGVNFSGGASGAPSGTWRCLGRIAATASASGVSAASASATAATLFQRIL